MALNFKTPSEVADEYLTHLKALKPEVNTKQTDSDWYIRAHTVGGVVSGAYADQKKISNDAFPQSARREALLKHLEMYFDEGFNAPTVARGPVKVSGASGSSVLAGNLQFVYEPNGNAYVNSADFTMPAAGSGVVQVVSVSTGQIQNLLDGSPLTVSSPPAGFSTSSEVYGAPISDGRDEESNKEASDRILSRIRDPIAGGKESDYKQWAKDADPSVTSANAIRHAYGLGTIGVVISAGTTDIDAALDAGDPIVLTPSDDLVTTVQAYIDTQRPINDCVHVTGATEEPVNVTVKVRYASGDGTTILTGQTLTQEQLVIREAKRAIYKTGAGGRRLGSPASGFVLASEIEEVIDLGLSDSPYTEANLKILVDRQVSDLSATGPNRLLLGDQVPIPGSITVIEM